MAPTPSETRSGSRWIENFPDEAQSHARLLLDSLHIVSTGTFRTNLTHLLSEQVRRREAPVAIYPIRALPDEIAAAPEGVLTHTELGSTSSDHCFRPLDLPYQALPGSEGIIGNIIREVIRKHDKIAFSPTSLDEIREARVRSIVLVDDFSGSGQRAVNYLNEWLNDPTIMSWYSYGYVRFHIVVGAITERARDHLLQHRHLESLHYFEIARDFSTAGWAPWQRAGIENLCRTYATKSTFRFGFGQARGLFTIQHTIANTLPMILWQKTCKKLDSWNPFFEGRVFPPQLQADLVDYKLEMKPEGIALSLRQPRLSASVSQQTNPTVRRHYLTLAAAARNVREASRLASVLDVPVFVAASHILTCKTLGLLDDKGRLTDAGRAELRKAKREPPPPAADLPTTEKSYYPLQLRGVDDV